MKHSELRHQARHVNPRIQEARYFGNQCLEGELWDNAPQKSFFGYMNDHIKNDSASCTEYNQGVSLIDNYIDYYNNYRYQWDLVKLSPNKFYIFINTGVYPLNITNIPDVPKDWKLPSKLATKDK